MGNRRLLLLDDERDVVDFLCESLRDRGFVVDGFTAPEAMLQRLGDGPSDLVITDMHMPGMRGTDILSAVFTRQPDQLVLLMTAFGSIESAVAAVRAGACDFIAKPFEIEALVFAVERAFRERRMRREIVRLRARAGANEPSLVAKSPSMRAVLDRARRAAAVESSVLLTGETGTGKGAIARFIHDAGPRSGGPFHQVNCASLPSTLVESELFGVRRGAFTDARDNRAGAFIAAGNGTLFLDEIGELPIEAQAKLLQALETRRIRALGATSDTPFRARVLAATNRPLEVLLREGRFRPDLYYRLNVVRIEVPPLRERRDDLLPLIDVLLGRHGTGRNHPIGVSAAALRCLTRYSWPGNVRELANVIERAVALCDHDVLLPTDLELQGNSGPAEALLETAGEPMPLQELELAYVRRVLESRNGNKTEAARILGIDRGTLYRILHRAERPMSWQSSSEGEPALSPSSPTESIAHEPVGRGTSADTTPHGVGSSVGVERP